ncbi:MAG: hypothetical protein ACQERC_09640 [Bacteroidota bacterium]
MKLFLAAFFLLICSASFAQQHATENTASQMTVDEILRAQSFDIDDPVSEKARGIIRSIYEDMNAFYEATESSKQSKTHKKALRKSLDQAEKLDLNITMFEEDIDHILK